MHKKQSLTHARGLTLVEVVVIVAVVGLLSLMLLPVLKQPRNAAWQNQDMANLRFLSLGMQSYAVDHQDLLPNLTQVSESKFSDVLPQTFDSAVVRAAKQVTEIIRRAGNRGESFPVRTNWLPHPNYTHLVLADSMGSPLLAEVFVSPSDLPRSKWRNWQQFENDLYAPMQPSPGTAASNRTFPYSSSYIANLSSYDRLASVLDDAVRFRRVQPGSTVGFFNVPSNSELGGTTLSTVQHPSRKVYYNASEQFNFKGQRMYYAVDSAQVAMTFFDGSASFRQTRAANDGWSPQYPAQLQFRTFYRQDFVWQPPVTGITSPTTDLITNRYTTTRDGLHGIDY